MSAFKVTSIDADKDPCKLAYADCEFEDLRSQVSNYLTYMQAKTGLGREAITCSMTLDQALINDLLNQGAEGIRIYLVKESADPNQQTDVSFLAVPVEKATDGPNRGLLVEMNEPVPPRSTTTAPEVDALQSSAIHALANPMVIAQPLLALKEMCPTGACPLGNTIIKPNHTLLG